MRTIDKVVEEIKSVYPNYVNPMMGDDDNQRLHDRLNEILETHKAGKRQGFGSCEDVISRQSAIETLNNLYHTLSDNVLENPEVTINRALGRIKILPSANQVRPKGKWIPYEVKLPDRIIFNYKCSVCGRKLVGYSTETLRDAPYCHCGADMRENEGKK